MQKFQRAIVPPSETDKVVADIVRKWNNHDAEIRALFPGFTSATTVEMEARRIVNAEHEGLTIWINCTYQVAARELGNNGVHLSIKRLDRQVIRDWRDLQWIKNELIGPECEAVELFPAESRLVDQANQYHLTAVRDPSFRFPFGFNDGRLVSEGSIAGSVQRPFEKEA